jgi:hypothetical protein
MAFISDPRPASDTGTTVPVDDPVTFPPFASPMSVHIAAIA